jgi:transposase
VTASRNCESARRRDVASVAGGGSAHYILGPFGPDTDLRRYGLKLCERGGKNAKKRAAVAVARKLAVLLHRLWTSGEVYEPLRHDSSPAIEQEAA